MKPTLIQQHTKMLKNSGENFSHVVTKETANFPLSKEKSHKFHVNTNRNHHTVMNSSYNTQCTSHKTDSSNTALQIIHKHLKVLGSEVEGCPERGTPST